MSFFNTIRGLGRSSKKNRKDIDTPSLAYPQNNPSLSPSRKSQSPTRLSPTKQQKVAGRMAVRSHGYALKGQYEVDETYNDLQGAKNQSMNETPLFMSEPFVKTALVKGSFKTIVQQPKYVDYGEWLALNIFEMFNNLNLFYGIFSEMMTPSAFPSMNAGPDVTYLWVDSHNKSINLPACQYIDYVLTWISTKLNDQSVFPTKNGGAFPSNFLKDCKNISRQMFRIFAFIYYNLFDKIIHLSLEAHWNSFFSHFISFVKEFSLLNRNEFLPLLPLIENFEQQGKIID